MKKRVFAIVLTIILCISVFSLSAFATDLSSPISRTQLLKIAEMQRGAVDAHEELYKTFLVGGVETYPVNYGGSYIDGSLLHVCIVDLPNQDISYYKNILKNHLDVVVFDNVDLSLQTLITSSREIATSLLADGIPVFTSSKYGDYAIVSITDSSFTRTNMVGDPSNPGSQTEITGTINRPATGLAIIKYGKNGVYAYGAVSSSNTTWYSSGNPDGIHGLVDVRLSLGRREPGDSGGPIYTADGLFCGTHTGAADEDNYGFSHIVFSPYVYVRNLGFSALTS